MANPNPTYKYKHLYGEPMSEQSLSIRVPLTQDKYVRSLPNRAEWLRRAIADAYERDMAAINGTDSDTRSNT
jgi:hypothetical protein